MVQTWCRMMVWTYEDTGKVSDHLEMPTWYFLHSTSKWTETWEKCCGWKDRGIELVFGFHEWFINVNHHEKCQLKEIKGSSTSFAIFPTGQNLQIDVVLKIWTMELGFLMEMVKRWIGEAPQIIWDFSWPPKW